MAGPSPAARQPFGILSGWRGFKRFWLSVLAVLGVSGGVLQVLGPPVRPVATVAEAVVRANPRPVVRPVATVRTDGKPRLLEHPGRPTSGAVSAPDAALMEPYPAEPNLQLPRIGADGRTPMAVYAAGFDPAERRPRVGILVAGIGMSEADSMAAIKTLPGAVTLAISPYATNTGDLLAAARAAAHEYLLSIPMEPQGYPVNDPDGRHALMTSLPAAENLNRLQWALARMTGYAGVTDALGEMRGERLAGVPDQLDSVLEEVAHRGLLYVDARIEAPRLGRAWNRSADIVVDEEPVNAATLDQRLDTLTQIAQDKGSALGVVSVPRPVTLERVAAWTHSLAAKGLVLAPVSALVRPPAAQEQEK